MQKYLFNLAQIHLLHKSKELGIALPDQGTHTIKKPRKQYYSLINNETKKTILSIQFFTNRTPIYFINQ